MAADGFRLRGDGDKDEAAVTEKLANFLDKTRFVPRMAVLGFLLLTAYCIREVFNRAGELPFETLGILAGLVSVLVGGCTMSLRHLQGGEE